MPLAIADWPAHPECGGAQWAITDIDQLALLTATVLVGRARHVAGILAGTLRHPAAPPGEGTRARLRAELTLAPGQAVWHRDGLLFEIICWIASSMTARPDEVISDPHLHATQQGADALKVSFDEKARTLRRATIYEQKCTDDPRTLFRDQALPALDEWLSGRRDSDLAQLTLGLLGKFVLSDEESLRVYNRLLSERPLTLQASLTVSPANYPTQRCVALFRGFSSLAIDVTNRLGITFPLADVRPWFEDFAHRVYAHIEAGNV